MLSGLRLCSPEPEALECSYPEGKGLGETLWPGKGGGGEEGEGEGCRKGGLPSTHLPEVPPLQEEPVEPDKGPAGARGGFPTKEAERRPFSPASALQGLSSYSTPPNGWAGPLPPKQPQGTSIYLKGKKKKSHTHHVLEYSATERSFLSGSRCVWEEGRLRPASCPVVAVPCWSQQLPPGTSCS